VSFSTTGLVEILDSAFSLLEQLLVESADVTVPAASEASEKIRGEKRFVRIAHVKISHVLRSSPAPDIPI
jgi:hypothetical protein